MADKNGYVRYDDISDGQGRLILRRAIYVTIL